jgi:hypothetical protein
MGEVVGSKLDLESVLSSTLRRGHHASIADQNVEGLALRKELGRARSYASKALEIELNEMNPVTVD